LFCLGSFQDDKAVSTKKTFRGDWAQKIFPVMEFHLMKSHQNDWQPKNELLIGFCETDFVPSNQQVGGLVFPLNIPNKFFCGIN
jgi:hypothetical protein